MKTNGGVTAGGLFPCTAVSSLATEHFSPPLLLELIFLVIYVIIAEEMKRK